MGSGAEALSGEQGAPGTSDHAAKRLALSRNELRSTPGLYRRAWRRFRQNRVAVAALVIVVAIVVFVLCADLIASYLTGFSYKENHLDAKLSHPGGNGYILGSDGNGRDILTRLAYGGRVSLTVAALATLSTLVIGGAIGATAGYFGGLADVLLMRFADVLLSIPTLSLLILISTLHRPGAVLLSLFIAAVGWPGVSRLIRGDVLSLRRRDFIEAARVIGASDRRIVSRHIFPNVAPTLAVWASQVVPGFILTEAALSFVGLGVRMPTPSWGNMLEEAQQFYRTNWTNVFVPGFMIFLTALSVNLMGNGLRDAFDPRLSD